MSKTAAEQALDRMATIEQDELTRLREENERLRSAESQLHAQSVEFRKSLDDNARLREAVKTLRKALARGRTDYRTLASHSPDDLEDAGPTLLHMQAALNVTADLVEEHS